MQDNTALKAGSLHERTCVTAAIRLWKGSDQTAMCPQEAHL